MMSKEELATVSQKQTEGEVCTFSLVPQTAGSNNKLSYLCGTTNVLPVSNQSINVCPIPLSAPQVLPSTCTSVPAIYTTTTQPLISNLNPSPLPLNPAVSWPNISSGLESGKTYSALNNVSWNPETSLGTPSATVIPITNVTSPNLGTCSSKQYTVRAPGKVVACFKVVSPLNPPSNTSTLNRDMLPQGPSMCIPEHTVNTILPVNASTVPSPYQDLAVPKKFVEQPSTCPVVGNIPSMSGNNPRPNAPNQPQFVMRPLLNVQIPSSAAGNVLEDSQINIYTNQSQTNTKPGIAEKIDKILGKHPVIAPKKNLEGPALTQMDSPKIQYDENLQTEKKVMNAPWNKHSNEEHNQFTVRELSAPSECGIAKKFLVCSAVDSFPSASGQTNIASRTDAVLPNAPCHMNSGVPPPKRLFPIKTVALGCGSNAETGFTYPTVNASSNNNAIQWHHPCTSESPNAGGEPQFVGDSETQNEPVGIYDDDDKPNTSALSPETTNDPASISVDNDTKPALTVASPPSLIPGNSDTKNDPERIPNNDVQRDFTTSSQSPLENSLELIETKPLRPLSAENVVPRIKTNIVYKKKIKKKKAKKQTAMKTKNRKMDREKKRKEVGKIKTKKDSVAASLLISSISHLPIKSTTTLDQQICHKTDGMSYEPELSTVSTQLYSTSGDSGPSHGERSFQWHHPCTDANPDIAAEKMITEGAELENVINISDCDESTLQSVPIKKKKKKDGKKKKKKVEKKKIEKKMMKNEDEKKKKKNKDEKKKIEKKKKNSENKKVEKKKKKGVKKKVDKKKNEKREREKIEKALLLTLEKSLSISYSPIITSSNTLNHEACGKSDVGDSKLFLSFPQPSSSSGDVDPLCGENSRERSLHWQHYACTAARTDVVQTHTAESRAAEDLEIKTEVILSDCDEHTEQIATKGRRESKNKKVSKKKKKVIKIKKASDFNPSSTLETTHLMPRSPMTTISTAEDQPVWDKSDLVGSKTSSLPSLPFEGTLLGARLGERPFHWHHPSTDTTPGNAVSETRADNEREFKSELILSDCDEQFQVLPSLAHEPQPELNDDIPEDKSDAEEMSIDNEPNLPVIEDANIHSTDCNMSTCHAVPTPTSSASPSTSSGRYQEVIPDKIHRKLKKRLKAEAVDLNIPTVPIPLKRMLGGGPDEQSKKIQKKIHTPTNLGSKADAQKGKVFKPRTGPTKHNASSGDIVKPNVLRDCIVRKVILDCYSDGAVPTVDMIYNACCESGLDFPKNSVELHLNSIGYDWVDYHNRRLLVENHKFTTERTKYFSKLSKYQGKNLVYIFVSEYVRKNENGWEVSANDVNGPCLDSARVVLHAMSNKRLLGDGLEVLKLGLFRLRNNDIISWLKCNVLPNIPEGSVVVLGHHPLFEKTEESEERPNITHSKESIVSWLTSHKVTSVNPDLPKALLLSKADKVILPKTSIFDKLIRDKGFVPLHLPKHHMDLNPVHFLWQDILDKLYKTPEIKTVDDFQDFVAREFSCSQKASSVACYLVTNFECSYRKSDLRFDELLEKITTTTGSSPDVAQVTNVSQGTDIAHTNVNLSETPSPATCPVCLQQRKLKGYRCYNCRGFWLKLKNDYKYGRFLGAKLPFCEQLSHSGLSRVTDCDGCRRYRYELVLYHHVITLKKSIRHVIPIPPITEVGKEYWSEKFKKRSDKLRSLARRDSEEDEDNISTIQLKPQN